MPASVSLAAFAGPLATLRWDDGAEASVEEPILEQARALDRFLASIEKRAFRMARIALRHDEDALDSVQDAMLQLARRYGRRPTQEWRPLFYRILQNRIRDCQRRRRVQARIMAWLPGLKSQEDAATATADQYAAVPDRAPLPAEQVATEQALQALERSLAELPGRQQEAFMLTPVAGAAPPPQSDTTPPAVNITSPASGATVTNTVSVSANAADDVGVASVQFLLDGSPLGAPVINTPYSVAWDTATAISGSHVLQARASDFAGNSTTSAAVSVSVGTPTGSTSGQWAAPVTWPIVAVNAALLPTGEILAWDGQDFGNQARVWNPATGTFTSVPNSLTNMFCTGQCLLPDGRALVVGGHIGAHVGLPDTNIFNPATRTWSKVAPMAVGRWYPTVTQLPDGRMLVTSGEIDCGECFAPIPEVYDPQFDHWTQLTGASQSFPYYPHMFVLSDGRVLAAASTEAPIVSRVLNIATQSWSVVDPTAVDGGSSAMYAPGKILKSGRSVDPDQPVIPSTATSFVIDMSRGGRPLRVPGGPALGGTVLVRGYRGPSGRKTCVKLSRPWPRRSVRTAAVTSSSSSTATRPPRT